MQLSEVARIEQLMHEAWPATQTLNHHGWLLRSAGGFSKRANSVLPMSAPADTLGAVEFVEEHYRKLNIQPCFQMSPISQPKELDRILSSRGYESTVLALVMTSPIEPLIASNQGSNDLEVMTSASLSKPWFDLWWKIDGRGSVDDVEHAAKILEGCPAIYATVGDPQKPKGVARAVISKDQDQVGIFCMAVSENERNKGIGKALIRALLAKAQELGATHSYLQVLVTNHAAMHLYKKMGYQEASRYWYRLGL